MCESKKIKLSLKSEEDVKTFKELVTMLLETNDMDETCKGMGINQETIKAFLEKHFWFIKFFDQETCEKIKQIKKQQDEKERYQQLKGIITVLLETNDIDEASKRIGMDITTFLEKRNLILKYFDEETWEKIKLIKLEQSKNKSEEVYKRLMDDVIFYMLNSLYTYQEICDILYIYESQLYVMISNIEYIEEHYGQQTVEALNASRQKRKNLPRIYRQNSNTIIKKPQYRNLVKPDVIVVSVYEAELVEKVLLFFENGGDTEKTAMNSKYHLNEIVASLNDAKLKDLLLDDVYQKLQNLLEIDSILTQNRTKERNALIKSVMIILYYEDGNVSTIEEGLGCTKEVVERIINHPYVPILCNKMGIDMASIALHEDNEKHKQKVL